jgi:putative AdoMet-dependent methyltransferase
MYPRLETESQYDRWSEDRRVSDAPEGFPFQGYNRVLDRIVEASGACPDESILEIGIGTGILARRFLERACRVIGLDDCAERLAEAKRKHPGLILHRSDIRSPWPRFSTPIHHVVAAYSLHELTLGGKLLVVRRALDLLPPNGRVLIGDVAFPSCSARLAASMRYRERWDKNEHYWAADETAEYFSDVGIASDFEPLTPCSALMTFTRALGQERLREGCSSSEAHLPRQQIA